MASVFAKEWGKRWIEGVIIAYIRRDYIGRAKPTVTMVKGALKCYIQSFGNVQEVKDILRLIKENPHILPTVPNDVKERKLEEIGKML